MTNFAWLGFTIAFCILTWVAHELGGWILLFNIHGCVLVLGGVFCSMLVNYPTSYVRRALVTLKLVFRFQRLPSSAEVAGKIKELGEVARREGGLLALQDRGGGFADGFLDRALLVAIAAGDTRKAREIMEADIRQTRMVRLEDANFWRTIGMLAPMFGLLGTLIGIILVLRNMSDPAKVGPSMALAITASLYGVSFANVFSIPVAGHIRTRAVEEARLQEAIMEGVLDLMRQESAFLLELRVGAYAPDARAAKGKSEEPAPK